METAWMRLCRLVMGKGVRYKRLIFLVRQGRRGSFGADVRRDINTGSRGAGSRQDKQDDGLVTV